VFSVKSAYGLLKGEGEEEDSRFYKSVWRIKALPLAHVTAWRVIENKVVAKVNLERRGIQIDSILCSLCRLSKESTNHLFFGCKVAWLIWNLCYDWLGMNSVDLIVPGSHLEHFKILDAPNSVNLTMGNIWIALVSEIWRHMNNCLFKGGVVHHTEVFSLTQVKVWSWINSKIPSMSFSFSEWCLEPWYVCTRFNAGALFYSSIISVGKGSRGLICGF